jgi:hypothetical protein
LERLELAGALVTIDAMGTQTDIAEKIVTRGGDFLLALKANWPLLHQEVVAFFDNPPTDMLQAEHETTDGDHGRIEERRHLVCHQIAWLFPGRRYADEPRFPHLAMIGMVESRVERNRSLTRERRYYLSSAPLDARARALRTVRVGFPATFRMTQRTCDGSKKFAIPQQVFFDERGLAGCDR